MDWKEFSNVASNVLDGTIYSIDDLVVSHNNKEDIFKCKLADKIEFIVTAIDLGTKMVPKCRFSNDSYLYNIDNFKKQFQLKLSKI